MTSLRELALCIGLPQDFSVITHFFGYASSPPWNLAPSQTNLPQSLSLLTQMKRLHQPHFHLNLIRVGTGSNGLLPAVDEQNLDCAVHITRRIYAAVGIGIGRVERWWMVPESDNTGYDVINDDCEAADLVDEYTVPNDGVDCFFVPSYVDKTAGLCPAFADGVVVESRENTFVGTARTMAHELGHLFGLGHENDAPMNLMAQTSIVTQAGISLFAAVELNADQIEQIKKHQAMKGSC
jgi:hypothetical protein